MISTPAATLRPARPTDRTMLGRLGTLLVRTHHEFDPRRFVAPTPETPDGYGSWLVSQMSDPKVIVFVAERDGVVVGYTYAGVEGRDWMSLRGPAGVLYDVVVDPAHRRHGIGKLLLDATLAELGVRGALQVVLSTAEQNEEAQRLFAGAGFRRTMVEMTREL